MWLLESILTIIVHQIEIKIIFKGITKVKNLQEQNDDEKKQVLDDFYKRISECKADTWRCVFDIPCAFGLTKSNSVSSTKIGILGTISSVIGLYQNY